MKRAADIEEIQQWLDEMESPKSIAQDAIETARHRGAKIKAGSPTERIMLSHIEKAVSMGMDLARRRMRRQRRAAKARLRKQVKRPD